MKWADRAARMRPAAAPGTTPPPGGRAIGFVQEAVRRASNVSLLIYALALGAGLGLASADYATSGGYPFGGVTVGAWTAWPRAGAVGADPYTRAVNARRGEIPLAIGEGMLLTAAQDEDGRTLDATCTYAIAGITPPARAWTVTVAGRGAAASGQTTLREGFTSTEILREMDGRLSLIHI